MADHLEKLETKLGGNQNQIDHVKSHFVRKIQLKNETLKIFSTNIKSKAIRNRIVLAFWVIDQDMRNSDLINNSRTT